MSWLAWQLADSAFPTGAFAHSAGLEAAHQVGLLGPLDDFLAAALHQQATTALPIVAAVNRDRARFDRADRLWEAITTNHVANRASRGIGQALLATAAKGLGCEELVLLRRRVRAAGLYGHQPVVWGAVTGALGLAAEEAQRLLLFTAARDLVSSAIRLGILGPTRAQVVLRQAEIAAAAALAVAHDRDWCAPATSFPLQDLAQGLHDRLYSRLFHS